MATKDMSDDELIAAMKRGDEKRAKVIADLTASLKQALRYIEVSTAYQGSMTAAQVEERIRQNKDISATQIGANSVNTLATFSFAKAREALKAAELQSNAQAKEG
jgi:hypothetical protein